MNPIAPPGQVHRIAELVVALLPAALRASDPAQADRAWRLVLHGSAGGDWTVPAGAARVEVTSFRGATLLSNGETLVENPAIAEQRAKKLQRVLVGLGIAPSSLVVTWKTEAERPDGARDSQLRRVVIAVKP